LRPRAFGLKHCDLFSTRVPSPLKAVLSSRPFGWIGRDNSNNIKLLSTHEHRRGERGVPIKTMRRGVIESAWKGVSGNAASRSDEPGDNSRICRNT
jgi:hypothetical protein